jgi:anti-sigma regulatory factor (Ser/Thr protein kinase)
MQWRDTFPPHMESVAQARAGVTATLADLALPAQVVDAVVVAAGELAGNAARHAGTDYTVSVSVADGLLRLEVFDRDTRPPALVGIDDDSISGRGLHIVAGLADDWGWRSAQDPDGVTGKIVWAEFAVEDPACLDPPPSADASADSHE